MAGSMAGACCKFSSHRSVANIFNRISFVIVKLIVADATAKWVAPFEFIFLLADRWLLKTYQG